MSGVRMHRCRVYHVALQQAIPLRAVAVVAGMSVWTAYCAACAERLSSHGGPMRDGSWLITDVTQFSQFSSVQFCFTSVVGHVQPLDGTSELRPCCGKVEAMPSGN
jgi:hypothetical protein